MLFEIINIPLNKIKGVAEKRENALNQMGIFCLYDLLMTIPHRYRDFSARTCVAEIDAPMTTGAVLTVKTRVKVQYLPKRKSIATVQVAQGDIKGRIVMYNVPYALNGLMPNKEYYIYGRYEKTKEGFVVVQPHLLRPVEKMDSLPVIAAEYKIPSDVSIGQRTFASIVRGGLAVGREYIKDIYPKCFLEKHELSVSVEMLDGLHCPQTIGQIERARRRLAFDELTAFLVSMGHYRAHIVQQENRYKIEDHLNDQLEPLLGFSFTEAQKRAVKAIQQDMASAHVMNRLVQGDVGSGKTAVAFYALLNTALGGHQSAFLAPTAVLAKQQYDQLSALAAHFDVEDVLLNAALKKAERERIKARLRENERLIAVGTHALFSEDISYRNLALVVADEQHKFGVMQRARLLDKGVAPHMLLMSATPIPRTLSMVMYAALDVSIIDEMPPGRLPVKTMACTYKKQEGVYDYILKRAEQGEQCYVVCAGIEEDKESDIISLQTQYEELSARMGSLGVGCVHGKMPQAEKDEAIRRFKEREIKVLVCTTVIEVGIDAKDATLIVINNAERFGLSQLHQMRGRVGRGARQAECILISDMSGESTRRRLEVMKQTNDGFEIAEQDFLLRGPGEVFGTKQSGQFAFRYTDIIGQASLLFEAKRAAEALLADEAYKPVAEKIVHLYDKLTEEVSRV